MLVKAGCPEKAGATGFSVFGRTSGRAASAVYLNKIFSGLENQLEE